MIRDIMLHTATAGQQAATEELYATLPKAGAMLTSNRSLGSFWHRATCSLGAIKQTHPQNELTITNAKFEK